jgi:histidinol-phosphatase (PHP family)
MYWSNYHSHNTFCDGRSSMEDFVKFAMAKGVKKYGFSSHAPLPFETFWNMNIDDFGEYEAEFHRLKAKYRGDIELFLGLEMDYINDYFELQHDLYETAHFDYLIGSIHYMDRLSSGDFWCIDGGFDDFYAGLQELFDGDIRQATGRYFEISKLMIEKGGFDIIGHFDKIALNASGCIGFNIADSWYKNLVGEVLQLIKSKGLIVEINTKSLGRQGMTYPDMQFFPLMNELQIPIVVNSDCHYPTNVIDGFKPTFRALKRAGFNTMQQLVDGKWQAIEFNERGLKE